MQQQSVAELVCQQVHALWIMEDDLAVPALYWDQTRQVTDSRKNSHLLQQYPQSMRERENEDPGNGQERLRQGGKLGTDWLFKT
jgi:hypothetical protein